MLELTPQEMRDFLIKTTPENDRYTLVMPPNDGMVRLTFKSCDDGCCYLLENRGDDAWVRELCRDAPDIHLTSGVGEYIRLGLARWPNDQSMKRMWALIEFHHDNKGGQK